MHEHLGASCYERTPERRDVRNEFYRRTVRTTNAIERLFVKLRRRLGPIGCLPDAASARRISYAVCAASNERRHRLKPTQHTTAVLAA